MFSQVVPWNVNYVGAPNAWSLATGYGAKILILSSGVGSHPDLPAIPPSNCGGWYGACGSYYTNGSSYLGIVAAVNNTIGIVGVAPGVRNVDIYSWNFIQAGEPPVPHWDLYITGLNSAVQLGVDVILTDVAYAGYWQAEATAAATAWASGSIMVAPIGDALQYVADWYPAGYADVIGVSGVRSDGSSAATSSTPGCTVHPGSNRGPHVDFAAPYWAYTTFTGTIGSGDEYHDTKTDFEWCASYLSAVHVAGILALMSSRFPTWTPSQIVAKLVAASSQATNRDDYLGYGVPNAFEALSVGPPPPPPPLDVSISGPSTVPPWVSCGFVGAASDGTEPYSFSWLVDGSPAGNGQYLYWSSGSSYSITLEVEDATGRTGSACFEVTVDGGVTSCDIQ